MPNSGNILSTRKIMLLIKTPINLAIISLYINGLQSLFKRRHSFSAEQDSIIIHIKQSFHVLFSHDFLPFCLITEKGLTGFCPSGLMLNAIAEIKRQMAVSTRIK